MSDEDVKNAEYEEKEDGEEEESEEETELATVGADPEDGEYENKEIRQKILQLLQETESKNWDLAVILETAYDKDMYRGWGFSSFREYVEKELSMHIRKAQYLVQLQEWFKKMPANIQKWVRELGWTKARMLMHVVKVENAAEWRNKVAGKSVAEIDKILKEAKSGAVGSGGGGGGDGGSDGEAAEKPINKNFKLFPPQAQNVDRALEKSQEISGSDKPGNNLDLICTEFLATHTSIESIQDMLRQMEKNLGVRLVAYSEETKQVVYGSELISRLEEEDAEESEIDEDSGSEEEDETGSEE